MRLLLDTQVALWTAIDSPRLPTKVRALVSDPEASLFVSVVSLWEVAIKHALRRGRASDMPLSAAELQRQLSGARCQVLDVIPAHVLALEHLPRLHGDPFDRMLVAQARAEPLRLITTDRQLAAYGGGVEVY